MQKIFIFCLFLISACTSTTLKTDSDVTRKQFVILPEFMALSMANEGYQQAKQKALENKQLNQDVSNMGTSVSNAMNQYIKTSNA